MKEGTVPMCYSVIGNASSWQENQRNFVMGFFHGYTEGFICALDFIEACADDHIGYTLLFDEDNVVRFSHQWENYQFSVDWLDQEQYEELKEAMEYLGE